MVNNRYNDNSILFNVLSKSGKAFVVPVKVANKNVLSPEIALVKKHCTIFIPELDYLGFPLQNIF